MSSLSLALNEGVGGLGGSVNGGMSKTQRKKNAKALANLKEMFFTVIDPEIVEMVFQANQFNVESTLLHLQSMTPIEERDVLAQQEGSHQPQQRSKKKKKGGTTSSSSPSPPTAPSIPSTPTPSSSSFFSSPSSSTILEKIAFIRSIFEEVDARLVARILEENDYDVERTVENLLSISFVAEEEGLSASELPVSWGDDFTPLPIISGTIPPASSSQALTSATPSLSNTELEWLEDLNKELADKVKELSKEIQELRSKHTTSTSSSSSPWAPSSAKKSKGVVVPYVSKKPSSSATQPQPSKSISSPPLGSVWNGGTLPVLPASSNFQSSISQLREMFPHLTRVDIAKALEQHNDNVESTIESLLSSASSTSISSLVTPPTSQEESSVSEKRRVDSTPSSLTLSFFGSSGNSTDTQTNEWKEEKPDSLVIGKDLSSRLKFSRLQERFWWIDLEILESIFFCNDQNLERATKTLLGLYPSLNKDSDSTPPPPPQTKDSHTSMTGEEPSFQQVKRGSKKKDKSPASVVLTEESIANYRKEVIKHAKLRSACYRQAASAFSTGNGKIAKDLSNQGKEHDKMMREALEVFINATSSAQQREKLLKVDLHGLQVKEALDVLEQLLVACSAAYEKTGDGPRVLYVITGQGRHSQGHRARIKPAVIEWLQSSRYRFQDNGGVIVVRLRHES